MLPQAPSIDAHVEARIAIANRPETRAGLVAIQKDSPTWYRPITKSCLVAAAAEFGVDPFRQLLLLDKEDGRLGTARRNSNSMDIGPGQINSIHIPKISETFSIPVQSVPFELAYNGCFNVRVMSWLLRLRTNEAGGNYWVGVAHYHSKNPANSQPYLADIVARARKVIAAAKVSGGSYRQASYQGGGNE